MRGRPRRIPDSTKRMNTGVRIDPEDWKTLRVVLRKHGWSVEGFMGEVVRLLLTEMGLR